MEISHDLARLDFAATSRILKATYWGVQRIDELNRRAFENSVCVIALVDGRQVGFARASGDRTLFARISDVIVWPEHRGKGVGKALVAALLDRAEAAGFRQMLAVIGDSENVGSIGLHLSLGFRQVGVLKAAGMKFGRWVDVVMMLRLQQERMAGQFIPSAREYHHLYGLTRQRLARAASHALVMHPGPMNRGVEIDSEVADMLDRAIITQQVEMGVAIRMACLDILTRAARGVEGWTA